MLQFIDNNFFLQIGIQQKNKQFNDLKTMNLCEENANVSIGKLMKAIGWEFLRTHASVIKDGGNHLASQQKGFQMINPTESWFPGNMKPLSSWTMISTSLNFQV